MHPTIVERLLFRFDAIRQGPFKHYMRALLPACFGLILMLACNRTPTISQAPASDLSVFIDLIDAPTAAMVTILVGFSKGGQAVALSGNLSMACNGIVFPPVYSGSSSSSISFPRQPGDEVYHCIYTDENGKKTPLIVPIPQGQGQLTSPAPGTTLPLTGPQYNSTSSPRPAGQVTSVTIRYVLPTPPSSASARVSAVAECGPPVCVAVRGDEVPATGTYVLTDARLPYGSGFETFPSGWSSEIRLFYRFDWSPPASGFQAVHMEYSNTLITPVTWSRD